MRRTAERRATCREPVAAEPAAESGAELAAEPATESESRRQRGADR